MEKIGKTFPSTPCPEPCLDILQTGTYYLRNVFNIWTVPGFMNASGLLQETRTIHDSMNIPKIEFIAYINILL